MIKKKLGIIAVSMGSGGAEKVLSLILPELVKQNDVKLFLFYDNRHFKIPEDVQVFILTNAKLGGFFNKILSFPLASFRIVNAYRKFKPSTSLSFLTRPNFLNGIVKIFFPEINTVISERCYPSNAYKSSKFRFYFYKFLIPLLYNKGNHLFSNSKYINEDLKGNFKLRIPMSVIFNPIETNIDIKNKIEFNTELCKIISVGSLHPIKNHAMLLKATSQLQFDWSLELVGDGALKGDLTKQVDHLNIKERVNFIGTVSSVNEYLLNAHIFTMSSNSEGFPNSLLEAMACEMKIVTTNCISGPLEMFRQNESLNIERNAFFKTPYGLMINVDDHIAMGKAITWLWENNDHASQMAKNARIRSLDFDLDSIMKQYDEII